MNTCHTQSTYRTTHLSVLKGKADNQIGSLVGEGFANKCAKITGKQTTHGGVSLLHWCAMYDMINGPWIRELKQGSVMSLKVSLIQLVRDGSSVDSESIALPEKNCRFDSMKSEIAPQAFRWQSCIRDQIIMGNTYSCTIIDTPRLVNNIELNNSLCRLPKMWNIQNFGFNDSSSLPTSWDRFFWLSFSLLDLAAQDVRYRRDDSVGTQCQDVGISGKIWEYI